MLSYSYLGNLAETSIDDLQRNPKLEEKSLSIYRNPIVGTDIVTHSFRHGIWLILYMVFGIIVALKYIRAGNRENYGELKRWLLKEKKLHMQDSAPFYSTGYLFVDN